MMKQTYEDIVLVIADDASTDGTSDYLKEHAPSVVVLQGNGNLWWTGGINLCIDYILKVCRPIDYVITINNDVTIDADYVSQKVARASMYAGAIIGSVCVDQAHPNIVETSGLVMNFLTCASKPVAPTNADLTLLNICGCVPATHLPAKGVLVPVGIYTKIGKYDFERLPHYHADTDFTLRAFKNGVKIYVDFDSIVYSNVNRANMTNGADITFSNLLKSFDPIRGINGFPAYRAFADIHFSGRQWQFLAVKYTRIILGLLLRYGKVKFKNLFSVPSGRRP
jgi:GT2 family glycosyltransferase